MDGWDLTPEERLENKDYINELRFGGDPSSDAEIKRRIYERDEEDFEDMRHGPRDQYDDEY